MKTIQFLLVAALICLVSGIFAQSGCHRKTVSFGVNSSQHTLHDPNQFPEAYVLVRIGVRGNGDYTIGEPTLSQYYHTGAEPLTIDLGESTLLQSIDSGAQDSSYLVLKCNFADMPFYPVKATLAFPTHQNEEELVTIEEITFYVWFTPWGTAEVWNSNDFHSLKRQWLTPAKESPDPSRITIDPSTLPVSDVPDHPNENEEWWYYEPNLVFVDSLAYAVPVMRTEEPYTEHFDGANRADDCGLGKQRFKYEVSGNLSSCNIFYSTYK